MRKLVLVLALTLGLNGAGSAFAVELEDGFTCQFTNPAEANAKESSSGAPIGGAAHGEATASATAQFNFCDQYPSE